MIPLPTTSPQMPSAVQGSAPQATQQLQIHDIHLPEQVSNLPTAIGWWLLAAILIITALWIIRKFSRNKKLNKSKNHALSVLKNQTTLSNSDLLSLLKWAAMQYFSRQQVANLYGESFQQFLIKQLPEKHQETFEKLSNQAFLAQYQVNSEQESDIDCTNENTINHNNDCKSAVKLWLTYALPPKAKPKLKQTTEQKQKQKQKNTTSNKQVDGDLAHD